MLRIKDLHPVIRPREKLLRYGPDALSDSELLALLLRSGTRHKSAIGLADEILATIETSDVPNVSIEKLQTIKGIGIAKAAEIIAAMEIGKRFLKEKKTKLLLTPHDIFEELHDIRGLSKEHFVVFFLDVRNQQIRREIVSIGTLDTNLVHPREVFEPAIQHHAAQIIISHNHPSGDPRPSDEDIVTTSRLYEAGSILGITLIDHVVVTKNSFFSFHQEGILS